MRRLLLLPVVLLFLLLPSCLIADTRALLVACSDFVTRPDLGNSISGNLHMLGSALLSSRFPLAALSIEDGTIGSQDALAHAITSTFSDADEEDLSILYLCTHGILDSADDGQAYLLLSDGLSESPVGSEALTRMLSGISGEKLLILDACYSGALIGHGSSGDGTTAFGADPSIHVLTSAYGSESSWYYDSDGSASGAVSYFASAICSGIGLFGTPEADLNADERISLHDLYLYLCASVPSSSAQLLSARADALMLPLAGAALSRPLSAFSYSSCLLPASDPTIEVSFTVLRDVHIQYRIVPYENGSWQWAYAYTLRDETSSAALTPGRKTRSISLQGVAPQDSGYVMLQIFSVSGSEVTLCSERLLAVQPVDRPDDRLTITCPARYAQKTGRELPVTVSLPGPALLSVTVLNEAGEPVRRLAVSQLTRPSADASAHYYWDGRTHDGAWAPGGTYTIVVQGRFGKKRLRAEHTLLLTD